MQTLIKINALKLIHWDQGTKFNALKLLQAANGEVKTAIVMEKKKCTYEEANRSLNNVNGSLKKTLKI